MNENINSRREEILKRHRERINETSREERKSSFDRIFGCFSNLAITEDAIRINKAEAILK